MKKLRYLFFLLLITLVPGIALAADHYVRAGAAGNGSGDDWTNAYTSLPTTLVRGDTYYIAAGTYPNFYAFTPESGTAWIKIKKATNDNPNVTSVAGWNTTYGTGQAILGNQMSIRTNYWEIDGVTGTGTSGYGFKINKPSDCNIGNQPNIILDGYLTYLKIKHIEASQCGSGYDTGQVVIYNVLGVGGVEISYNYLHDAGHMILTRSGYKALIEHNYFKDNWSSTNNNGAAISGYTEIQMIYRYNIFDNVCNGTACIALEWINQTDEVYGNLFFGGSPSNGVVSCSNFCNYFAVHNNSIIDMAGGNAGTHFGAYGTGSQVYNNLWYNNPAIEINGTHDYNAFSGSDGHGEVHAQTGLLSSIFLNYSGKDFMLKYPTSAGKSLSSPYNVDLNNNIRGADGTWDRGTYEYRAMTSPSAPPNLRFVN